LIRNEFVEHTLTESTGLSEIAKAERILNRTLAYQAAMAVHELKERLGLDVREIALAVAPLRTEEIGAYRVVCTIKSLQPDARPVEAVQPVDVVPRAAGESPA
jgi:hypothetical protein